MKTGKKRRGKSRFCLGLAFLLLLSVLLTASPDRAYAYSLDEYPYDYDVKVMVDIRTIAEFTPDPGQQVFHFRIWSEHGVNLEISNNAVTTYGVGVFEGHLKFSVATQEEAETLCNGKLYIQQYDGNENWEFDTHLQTCYFNWWTFTFDPGESEFGSEAFFVNYYNPVTPPAPAVRTFTIPCNANITKASASVPDPGAAVFHFRIWSDSGVAVTIVNNAISTNGTGEFRTNLEFTVPEEQAYAFTQSRLHIQQYDGNADWQFDTYTYDFEFGRDSDGEGFFRLARPGENLPAYLSRHVYVNNVYSPAQPAPPPVDPAGEEEPEPVPEDDDDKGTADNKKEAKLAVGIKLNNSYKAKREEGYYAGEAVVLWVTLFNSSNSKTVKNVTAYEGDTNEQICYDKHIYPAKLSGAWNIETMQTNYAKTFMYYHVITPEEAEAGTYVFKCYLSATDPDNGKTVTSDTYEFELKTSGVYYGNSYKQDEPEKEPKTDLTVAVLESSQPTHMGKDWEEFYAVKDKVRFKVELRNETVHTYYDIEVYDPRTEKTTVFHKMKPGSYRRFFVTSTVSKRDHRRNSMGRYVIVTYRDEEGNTYSQRSSTCWVDVRTPEIKEEDR